MAETGGTEDDKKPQQQGWDGTLPPPPSFPEEPSTDAVPVVGADPAPSLFNRWQFWAAVAVVVLLAAALVRIGTGGSEGSATAASSDAETSQDSGQSSPATTGVTPTTIRRVTTTTTRPLGPPFVKEECQDIPPAGVFQKDSASYVGTCIHFWASVFQFDAATGSCSFLGTYGNFPAQYNFEYEGGTVRVDGIEKPSGASVGDGSRSAPGGTCGLLGPIVEGDKVEVWGVVDSVDSYSTAIGGSNTYTIIKVVDIVKIG